eukprot:SAG11_NODE_4399_length_1912_cov_1.757860_2_plen_94_part_00
MSCLRARGEKVPDEFETQTTHQIEWVVPQRRRAVQILDVKPEAILFGKVVQLGRATQGVTTPFVIPGAEQRRAATMFKQWEAQWKLRHPTNHE